MHIHIPTTHSRGKWNLKNKMFGMTMVEPRERLVACPTSRTLQHHQSPQRQYHQVIKTTRIHHSSKNSRVVTVQEKVIRSRLQLGYSTPTNFINRYCFLLLFFFILKKFIWWVKKKGHRHWHSLDKIFNLKSNCSRYPKIFLKIINNLIITTNALGNL